MMSRSEFEGWVSTTMEGFASAPMEADVAVLFATDDRRTFLGQAIDSSLVMRAFTQREMADYGVETINTMLLDGPPRTVAAMATQVLWSPEDALPTVTAWLATVVAPGLPATFAVKRWAEDKLWWRLEPADAPWLMLSCASGLRHALEDAKPLVFKVAEDRRLLSRVDEGTPPPVDEHGRI